MRRVLAALLVVLLPLQWGWAVAAATCIDGGWTAALVASSVADTSDAPAVSAHGHAGHHVHAPAADPASDRGDDATPAVDCAVCHLPVAAFVAPSVPGAMPRPAEMPPPGTSAPVPEPPLQRPFRPPMAGA